MKKLLLGTTALIAAGAFVGAAQAGDDEMMAGPVTVGIAGYTVGAIGFASDTDDATRGEEIFHVYRVRCFRVHHSGQRHYGGRTLAVGLIRRRHSPHAKNYPAVAHLSTSSTSQ